MNFGANSAFGFGSAGGGGGGGGSGLSVQFTWVVGGPANFSSNPVPPVAGATTFTSTLLSGKIPIVSRGGLIQASLNPGTGNSYFTFAGTTITFHPALGAQEEMQISA